jgi:flagellar basal-body rod protein FlgC
MDYANAFAISAAGMAFERLRADVAATNIANAHTTRGAAGGPYRPLQVVAATGPASFSSRLSLAAAVAGLQQPVVLEAQQPPRMVHEPGHPHADSNGFVAYPSVDPVGEMVSLMRATRAYEANVAAFSALRAMALKALEIGGR